MNDRPRFVIVQGERPYQCTVIKDGKDISKEVRGVTVDLSVHTAPVVKVEYVARSVLLDIEGSEK